MFAAKQATPQIKPHVDHLITGRARPSPAARRHTAALHAMSPRHPDDRQSAAPAIAPSHAAAHPHPSQYEPSPRPVPGAAPAAPHGAPHDFSQVPLRAAPSLSPALLRTAPTGGPAGAALEDEADRAAERVMRTGPGAAPAAPVLSPPDAGTPGPLARTARAEAPVQPAHTPPPPRASVLPGLGAGRPLSAGPRQHFERAFAWNFTGVRLHAGPAAAEAAKQVGARAFTVGRNIVFGGGIADPEDPGHRRLLAHELAHVVQQDGGTRAAAAPGAAALSAASPTEVQAAPIVTAVATSAAELGVGGTDITATATIAGATPALTWTINPVTAGVAPVGVGRTVRIHAAQPGAGVVVGGNNITVTATVTGTGDNAVSAPVMLVQVVSAAYAANPALVAAAPANTAEPNRDGIGGNTAQVNAVTAPAGRPVTVTFRRSLGAAVAGNVVTPGSTTGDIGLRISDTATRARLDETQPSVAGPAALMADMTVNAVPTRVASVGLSGPLGPYGQLDPITYAVSDNLHPPNTRVVGELITLIRDDFNVPPANGAFNNVFNPVLSAPVNNWNDQVITPAASLNVADGLPAIDINRFAGPGVPGLPRSLILRQRFVYASWQVGGPVVSRVFDDGRHTRSLIGTPAVTQFRTTHSFGAVVGPSPAEPYVGNPLITFSNARATPAVAGVTDLVGDGATTAQLSVASTVAGRQANWSVIGGDSAVTAGNPAVLPATATLTAGVAGGTFTIRAADTVFPNRRADGRFRVLAVRLHNMTASPNPVAAGTLASFVTVFSDPGGRNANFAVDAAAAAAGVVVSAVRPGPGAALNVTVTRPAAFRGVVTVTATDTVVAARTANVRIRFL